MADSLKSAAGGASDAASSGADKASSATGSGTQDWEAMSEEQKKSTYDALPAEKKQGLSYYEWVMQGYQNKKENWMPWIEDMYLSWFTSDNKASYATKDAMDKSKVTGVDQVDTLQDGVNNTVAGQVGQGGLLQPVGDAVSQEGVNRAERGGKDDSGSYAGSLGSGVSSAGGSVMSGAKSAGGYVGGMFGGGQKEESK
ncbi:uncharacterized protein LTR77_002606 [Saxophila tyrrhenica]|uniref:Uncharacterized protein n=1 Tax=Saxophila tyrrhenica TaxID=1690608 RepID=A0AAV9PMI2_9PEZI|nr:hypothetical protein LTR77_002606 [Saxophila tyrrhenica]